MEKFSNITMARLEKNVGSIERIISALGGFYLLYDSLKNKKRSIPEMGAAGFMLFRAISGYCPVTQIGNKLLHKNNKTHSSNINIHVRLLVKKPVAEVYNFWRHLGNLPLFMKHLESVAVLSDTLSEWKAKLPGNISLNWKAEIVGEEPYRYIGWHSIPDSDIESAGKVEFKDAGELGTLVHVVFSYHAPFGFAGEELAKLLNPVFEKMVRKDIQGFKRFMETGSSEKINKETTVIYT